MRAVLDTNVLISGVIATGVPHKLLVKGFNHEYQIVVSGDGHLLSLDSFRDIEIVKPRTFYDLLDEQ